MIDDTKTACGGPQAEIATEEEEECQIQHNASDTHLQEVNWSDWSSDPEVTPTTGKTKLHLAALAYAAAGRKVFPCVPRGKEPLTPKGFHDASDNRARIDLWWEAHPDANIAFCPETEGLAVIDADDYGVEGGDALAPAEAAFGNLPDTYTVRTPRGGRHLYFKGDLPPSQNRIAPHTDTRGRGSYCLLAPSVFEGGEYVVEKDIPPAVLPDWPGRIIAEAKKVKAEATTEVVDLDINVNRALSFLATQPPAVTGDGGDNATFVNACWVLNMGLSQEKAFEVMQAWNERSVPPWPADELKTKIANAAKYAENEAGAWGLGDANETFAAALAALPAPLPDTPISFMTYEELLAAKVHDVEELIPGILEKKTATFLIGPGGSNKSRLALQWGLCIGTSTNVWGLPVLPATVLYLSYEDPVEEVIRRVHSIAAKLELPTSGVIQYHDQSVRKEPLARVSEQGVLTVQPFGEKFLAHLRGISGHKLLIVDSTYNAIRMAGRSKIDEDAVMGAIGWLQTICEETDTSIIVLWHPSQTGQDRGDAGGWSVAWTNAPRARVSMTPDKDDANKFVLKTEKRNHAPKGPPVTLQWSGGALLPISQLGDSDKRVALMKAAARVAIQSAVKNRQPVNKRDHLWGWQIDAVEQDIGSRPTQKQIKEALAACLPAGLLRYLTYTRHQTAGYYPPEVGSAEELARYIKREAVADRATAAALNALNEADEIPN